MPGGAGGPSAGDPLVVQARAARGYANPDGGFWKFPTSPSGRHWTLLCVTALCLAPGEVAHGSRPAAWYRPNPVLGSGLAPRGRAPLPGTGPAGDTLGV